MRIKQFTELWRRGIPQRSERALPGGRGGWKIVTSCMMATSVGQADGTQKVEEKDVKMLVFFVSQGASQTRNERGTYQPFVCGCDRGADAVLVVRITQTTRATTLTR